MTNRRFLIAAVLLFVPLVVLAGSQEAKKSADWAMNTTIIEACSCPMFCQCYFNAEPAGHHAGHGEAHFCKFNNAYRVNKGNYGATSLDGAKFWIAGDLGGDFSKGEMDWAVLHFDPSVTKEQRDGIAAIAAHVFPVKWKSFTVGQDYSVEWNATADRAVAKLGGGKAGEVVLNRFQGMNNDPVVIRNLKYWGAPRNDGFIMMPNEVEAYRIGDKQYEYKGTNGFMITFDINSKDVAKPATGMSGGM